MKQEIHRQQFDGQGEVTIEELAKKYETDNFVASFVEEWIYKERFWYSSKKEQFRALQAVIMCLALIDGCNKNGLPALLLVISTSIENKELQKQFNKFCAQKKKKLELVYETSVKCITMVIQTLGYSSETLANLAQLLIKRPDLSIFQGMLPIAHPPIVQWTSVPEEPQVMVSRN